LQIIIKRVGFDYTVNTEKKGYFEAKYFKYELNVLVMLFR